MKVTVGEVVMVEIGSQRLGVRRGVAVVLVLWLAGAFVVSAAGLLENTDPTRPPLGIGVSVLLPLAVFPVWYALSGRFREWVRSLDPARLVGLQLYRVLGGVFVIVFFLGALPAGFALPAGLGDVAIGIAAPFVARQLASGARQGRRNAVIWCVLGLADLVIAVTLGVLMSPSAVGVLAGEVTAAPVTSLPLSLIPIYLVPVSVLLHVATLRILRTR
jgi:hypothetical protein